MAVELHFGWATHGWVVGKALSEMHDLRYDDDAIGFIKMGFDKDKLNDAISKVMLITGNKVTQHGNITVNDMIESPAGDQFKMDDTQWKKFKEWLKEHGEILEETDNTIAIAEHGYSLKYAGVK